jgi:tetratricopeptide (TPR) repeat protein
MPSPPGAEYRTGHSREAAYWLLLLSIAALCLVRVALAQATPAPTASVMAPFAAGGAAQSSRGDAASDAPVQAKYAALIKRAANESAQGELSAAKSTLQSAIALQPADAAGWCELGILYGRLGDYGSAEVSFRRAILLDPALSRAHYLLGLSLIAHPRSDLDWPGAMAEFRTALKLQPDYAEALNYLGVGLTSTGQAQLAVPELQHAVRLAPQMASARFNLAAALEASGLMDEATAQYRNAIQLRPEFADASSALGKLLLRMGQPAAAEVQLRAALHANPDLQDAHYALARVLRTLKRNDEAAIEFDEAAALNQRGPDAIQSSQLSNQALQMAGKGDFAAAETALQKAILLRPDYGVPHYNLGLIFADEGHLDQAARQLTEAISLMPGQGRPWFDLGRVQRLQGDQGSATASFWQAAALDPSDLRFRQAVSPTASITPPVAPQADTAAAHLSQAIQLRAAHDWQGSLGELLRTLALQPNSVAARLLLADSYRHMGNSVASVLELRKSLLVAPDNAEARQSLEDTLGRAGKFKATQ